MCFVSICLTIPAISSSRRESILSCASNSSLRFLLRVASSALTFFCASSFSAKVGAIVAPGQSGITLTGAIAGDNPLFAGQTPQIFAIGDPAGIGVADQLPGIGQSVIAANGQDLFRLQFTIDPNTNGQFTLTIDPGLFQLTDANGNAIADINLIGGTITVTMAAVLVDLGFPVDSLNGFFILSRTIGLIGHWVDQKRQDSRLIRLFDYLVNYAAPKRREVPPLK